MDKPTNQRNGFITSASDGDRRENSGETLNIRLLTTAPGGSYVAYWCQADEQFHLLNADGKEVWSVRINTDRAGANDIRFSAAGDTVAFLYDYDGGHQARVRHLPTGNVRSVGPSFDGPIDIATLFND